MEIILEIILKIMLGVNLIGFLYRLKINIPNIYFHINYEKVIIIIPIIIILFIIYLFVETTNNISFIKNELSEIRKILIEINEKEINEKEINEKEIMITKNKRKIRM
jgi:heme/copper-type cytochrome/quinol oxidase subunit 2